MSLTEEIHAQLTKIRRDGLLLCLMHGGEVLVATGH